MATSLTAQNSKAAPKRTRSASDGYFSHHGWLAPGVRLFRTLKFPAKAALVSITFLVPLVLLGVQWFNSNTAQAKTATLERAGMDVVEPAFELLAAAHGKRRALVLANDAQAAGAAEASAFERLKLAISRTDRQFTLGQHLDRLSATRQSFEASLPSPDSDAKFKLAITYVHAILDFIDATADQSGLSLDPELESYHMVSAAILNGPYQLESTAVLRNIGLGAIKSGSLNPSMRTSANQAQGIQDFLERTIEASYQKFIAADAERLERLYDMKGTDAAVTKLNDYIEQHLLSDTMSAQLAEFAPLADAAHSKQVELNTKILTSLRLALNQRIARLQRIALIEACAIGISLALSAYLFLVFYRVTLGGISEVAGHLDGISHGNLNLVPEPWGADEAADLIHKLQATQTSLRHVVGVVREASASLQVASEEIAASAVDLAQRTEQSASDLEETASSMEQITATVKQTAATVQDAASMVTENASSATRGGQVIQQVVQTMDEIRSSSGKIGEIISVIDGIAFQTNILALNAAVEAARAGEHGRGFAVVASEVRTLAQRSAAAAKEIKLLIEESLGRVEAGSSVVSDAGKTIAEVVASASKIAKIMEDIQMTTHEQSQGASLVSAAIESLDQSTQQNATLVEQTSAAAQALTDQAGSLNSEMAFFTIKAL